MSSPRSFYATVTTVDHTSQRYETVGDWIVNKYNATTEVSVAVRVSRTSDWRHAALLAVHELVEAILCRDAGITTADVDAFDLAHTESEEPGDLDDCPYRIQHQAALDIERRLARYLNIDWQAYSDELDAL